MVGFTNTHDPLPPPGRTGYMIWYRFGGPVEWIECPYPDDPILRLLWDAKMDGMIHKHRQYIKRAVRIRRDAQPVGVEATEAGSVCGGGCPSHRPPSS